MLKKTIKYTDYDGVAREEDFYFNLSRADLIELECGVPGGFTKKIETISKTADPSQILPIFKDIILRSYGKKSDDGKRFIKSKELSEEFSQTEAYSELMMEFITDEKAAADFINGLTNLKPEEIEAAKAKANIAALPSVTAAK